MDYQWARNRQEQELLRELELRKSEESKDLEETAEEE
jgi:hypothetical protein